MASIIRLGEYELNLEEIEKEIEKNHPEKILIQLPDGLKRYARIIIDWIKTKYKDKTPIIYLWLDTGFGACDIPLREAKELGIDLLNHIGHDMFVKSTSP